MPRPPPGRHPPTWSPDTPTLRTVGALRATRGPAGGRPPLGRVAESRECSPPATPLRGTPRRAPHRSRDFGPLSDRAHAVRTFVASSVRQRTDLATKDRTGSALPIKGPNSRSLPSTNRVHRPRPFGAGSLQSTGCSHNHRLPQPSTPPQCTENPPSTNSECPVTYPDAALARNTAAPAKSSGTPLRPTVVRAASAAIVSASSWRRWLSGVSTKPGTSVFAVTPRADHASDCERASDSRPPLETPYTPLSTNDRCACCDEMWISRPYPRDAMPGAKRCPSRNGASRFTVS